MKLLSTNKIKAVGIMSGTSLDGLDLVAAEFWQTAEKWNFAINSAETISYSKIWLEKLKNSPSFSGEKLFELHAEYGKFIGKETNKFIHKTGFIPDLIASHGHTVFHQPEKGFTFQIGNGADIAATTQITTIADFRTADIALGGQGAPLVPIGDKLLFSGYDFCLNLGGFANISFEKSNKRIAFDICPTNFVLNHFAEKQGFSYDKNGELGRKGNINNKLLEKLNLIEFYNNEPPKSLGREWVENIFMPIVNNSEITDEDKLRTVYEHIAQQIADIVEGGGKGRGEGESKVEREERILVTGGGAFNTFLIELISTKAPIKLVIPSNEIINFKEALIFAFLGVLKITGQNNCLSSVTGAMKDHSSGIVFNI